MHSIPNQKRPRFGAGNDPAQSQKADRVAKLGPQSNMKRAAQPEELAPAYVTVAKAQADIAERNWQTENEKVVLELMERRLAIYSDIRAVIAEVMQIGKSDDDTFRRYLQAIDQVPYLFGPEVETYLNGMRDHLAELQLANAMMANNTSPDYQKGVQLRMRELKAVLKFYEEAKPIFGPYIRAHQRVWLRPGL